MFRLRPWIYLLALIFTFAGCQKEEEEGSQPIEVVIPESTYTPPADGKITQEQIEAYIRAAKLLNSRVVEQGKAIHAFAKTYNLSDDLHELQDSLFIKEHPKVEEKYAELFKESQEKLDEVYSEVDLGEDEFTWIGGALADTVNQEIRKKVEEALRPSGGEEGT